MKIAGLKFNDIVDCKDGICVSLWTQGCPHHCKGCHNPDTWSFTGGREVDINELVLTLIGAIPANGIKRDFSILGGEPLCPANLGYVNYIINKIRNIFPDIKIYVWTGYTLEELKNKNDDCINNILNSIDILIDGRYEEDKRDITLKLRGSSNQKIHYLNKK